MGWNLFDKSLTHFTLILIACTLYRPHQKLSDEDDDETAAVGRKQDWIDKMVIGKKW